MVKIKLNSLIDLSALKFVENKLIMFSGAHRLLLITDVKVVTEQETYGRKKNKTRQVKYVLCNVHGWNNQGEFTGTYDQYLASQYLQYDLLHLRKNYIEFQKQWEALHALHEKITEPDFVKAVPE
jgi:hypothetical protein